MKQRIISALIALLVATPIFFMGGTIYNIAIWILSVLALKELLDIKKDKRRFPLPLKIIAYLIMTLFVFDNYTKSAFIHFVDYRLISILLLTLLLPIVIYKDEKKYNVNDALFLVAAILLIGMAFNLLIVLRNYDILYLVYLFLITIITDIYAYVTGVLIGHSRMIPTISPNKTWEGLVGGTIVGTFVAAVFYLEVINHNVNLINLITITLILSLVGQLGDLIFSAIKRYYNKKDFSNIMPGHGGILDRLDSIILVVITFMLFITII